MKKKIVRIISMVLIIIMITAPLTAHAAGENNISASVVTAKPGETVEIPVMISGNTGIMGFAITFSYDSSAVKPVSAERGAALTEGMFNDSIGTGGKNSFRIVWSGTENFSENGELCVVSFKVSDSAAGDYTIKLSCDKEDTFDENYRDVSLNCSDIKISTGSAAQELTLWQKIVNFLVRVWNWIKGIFTK